MSLFPLFTWKTTCQDFKDLILESSCATDPVPSAMSVPSSPVTTLMLLAILLRCAPWKCMPLFLSLFLAYLALLGMGILGMAVLSVSIVGYTSWRFLPSLARFFFKSLKCITMNLLPSALVSMSVFSAQVARMIWERLGIEERMKDTIIANIHLPSFPRFGPATPPEIMITIIPEREPSRLPCRFSECYICYERPCEDISKDDFDLGEDVAALEEVLCVFWCRGCWHPVHKDCWMNWQRTQLAQRRPLICAFCRTPWNG
ncbi:hypothetical protein Moror_7838 [Moniliophthora roreri MCA 2997]|uniref:Uncharacterized protein n=1 Tax=Moniliophthora roreri (strain MCA 2997) TaxID=1381753 RepID=V2YEH7_MONRO|nr:hypothetical protein Moror_7838 [Moniliophthora roreri MCA 2997]